MPFCNFVQTYKMQRLILILLSSFFLLVACNGSKPKGTLSQKTMIDLMTDIHLVDGYLNTLAVDSTRKVIDGLYAEVFAKYDIDSATFKTNLAYYLGNPVLSKDMYAEVTKRLNGYEADYRRADSLSNAMRRDSMQVVQRFRRLQEAARKLILEVELDTVPLNFYAYQKEFMAKSSLSGVKLYQPELIWQDTTVQANKLMQEGAVAK